MKKKRVLGRIAKLAGVCGTGTLALCLTLPAMAAQPRSGADSGAEIEADGMAAFKEVMRECKHSSVAKATLFVAGPVPMNKISTPAQDEAYASSEDVFQKSVRGNSPCWTRERFRRYVLGALQSRRTLSEKINASHAPRP